MEQTNYEPARAGAPEVDLVALFYAVLRKAGWILAAAVLLGAVSGGAQWAKARAAAERDAQQYAEDTAEYLETRADCESKADEAEARLRANEREQAEVQARLEQVQRYRESSVLCRLDPYAVPTADAVLYVSGAQAADAQRVYARLLLDSETLAPLAAQLGLEESALRELIAVNGAQPAEGAADTGLLSLCVQAESAEQAETILDALLARQAALADTVRAAVGEHTVTLLSRSAGTEPSAAVRDAQQAAAEDTAALEEQLQTLESEQTQLESDVEQNRSRLEALAEPQPADTAAAVRKRAATGFVLGGVLALCAAALGYLTGSRVYSAQELQASCGVAVLAGLTDTDAKPHKGLAAWADRREGRPSAAEDAAALALLAAAIRARAPQAQTVVVTGDAPAERLAALAAALQSAAPLQGVTVAAAGDVLTDAEAAAQAAAADAVVLAAVCGRSTYAGVRRTADCLHRLGKPPLGCVVYG